MSRVLTLIDGDASELRATELLGRQGESLAADHLTQNGYRIVLTNFKVPVGRNRQPYGYEKHTAPNSEERPLGSCV